MALLNGEAMEVCPMSAPQRTQVCNDCRHYDARNKVCRRYPPRVVVDYVHTVNDVIANSFTVKHPSVEPDYWCGEYKFYQKPIVDCIGGCGRRTRSKEQLCPRCLREARDGGK